MKLFADGVAIKSAAVLAGLKHSTAKSIIDRYKRDGCQVIVRQHGGSRGAKLTPAILGQVEQILSEPMKIPLRIMAERIFETHNVRLSLTCVRNAVIRIREK